MPRIFAAKFSVIRPIAAWPRGTPGKGRPWGIEPFARWNLMELRDFALQILSAEDLDTKLAPPAAPIEALTDDAPGKPFRARGPGRPPELQIAAAGVARHIDRRAVERRLDNVTGRYRLAGIDQKLAAVRPLVAGDQHA